VSNGLSMQLESKEVESLIKTLLDRVERPKKLLDKVEKYVKAVTMQMLKGSRPDTKGRRGIKWPKLKKSTVKQKKALVASGNAIVAARPMVRTGKMRDSIKTLSRSAKGFLFGTRIKSKDFAYPGFHNKGRFPWLFLTQKDYAQISKMVTDHLKGELKRHTHYVRK